MRFFEINGDLNHNQLKKFFILLQIALDVFQETKNKKKFKPKVNHEIISKIVQEKIYSPGRLGSLNYLINFIKNHFSNKELKVLDLGCGSGRYYNWIRKINADKDYEYVGIDVKENPEWMKLRNDNVRFYQKDIQSVYDLDLPINPNFIFSQSALEHARNDILLLKTLVEKYPNTKQLHILPGSISGINYLAHGYRRYNKNELNRICKSMNIKFNIISFSGKKSLIDYFLWLKVENESGNKIKKHLFEKFFKYEKEYSPNKNLDSYCGIGENEYPVQYALEIN